jgi:glycine oxidase
VSHTSADVAVIGAGVIGLTVALSLADTGLDVALITDVRAGEASPAAGGILDASHGFRTAEARESMRDACDRWPTFAAALTERTGVAIPVSQGVLELAPSIHEAERLHALTLSHATWLDDRELIALEPQLTHVVGALHYTRDGSVNPLVLLKALKQAVGKHVHIRVEQRTVAAIATTRPDAPVTLTIADSSATSTTLSAMRVVIAAGAWSGSLAGVPMHLPVSPVRGQLMSVASKALRHVVMLGEGYAIPRGDGRTIIGSTMEHVGFDAAHTPEGSQKIRALAAAILPSLGTASMLSTWAGLRPMTRDGLPIIGPDDEHPSVIYACGHGKNGILLAPITAALVTAMVAGSVSPTHANLFSPSRFSSPPAS